MIVVRFGICFDHSSTAKSSVAEEPERQLCNIVGCREA